MSMPQHIVVAIVSKDKKLLEDIKKTLALPDSGINPKYYYFTPRDNISKILDQEKFEHAFIDLWITLDGDSYKHAENQNARDQRNEKYNRGFYDQLLPETIVNIDQTHATGTLMENLKQVTRKIFDAFCESS